MEPAQQRSRLDFIKRLNEFHLEDNAQDQELAARIASYELAYRMQNSAPEVVDFPKRAKQPANCTASTIHSATISPGTACSRGALVNGACDSYSYSAVAMPEVIPGTRTAFSLREKVKLQFRAEAFNCTNTPTFGTPGLDINSATFGVVTATAFNPKPREVQLALRLLF